MCRNPARRRERLWPFLLHIVQWFARKLQTLLHSVGPVGDTASGVKSCIDSHVSRMALIAQCMFIKSYFSLIEGLERGQSLQSYLRFFKIGLHRLKEPKRGQSLQFAIGRRRFQKATPNKFHSFSLDFDKIYFWSKNKPGNKSHPFTHLGGES